jgi:hypothetical protein
METPHDPRYDDIEKSVEELFARRDKIYHAWMDIILDSTHRDLEE